MATGSLLCRENACFETDSWATKSNRPYNCLDTLSHTLSISNMQNSAFILTLAIACSLCPPTWLAAQDLTDPATNQQLVQQLQRRVTVAWQGQQLAAVFSRLSETQEFFVWLDRRVDLQQTVEASFTDLPIQQVLEQLAKTHSLGISVLENLVYVGPKQSAHELATLLKQARNSLVKAPYHAKHRWLNEKSTTWLRLSQPRDLLTTLSKQAGVTLLGGETIPHDLWDSKQLPSLALVDKTVLLLVGFDLTCQIAPDGSTCQVVPIKRPVVLKQSYRITKNRKRLLAELPNLVPEAQLEFKGRTLLVTGRYEDQLKVQQALTGKQPKPSQSANVPMADAKKVFSLRLKNQAVGGVINQLARQLKLQVLWDQKSLAKANRSQQTLVSCDLKNVPLDELLRGILAPAGMKFQKTGTKIEITSAP